MAFEACIAAVREASGGKLSDADAEALISKIDRRLRALEVEGAVDDANARLAQAAREAADEAAIETALKAKHAALNVLKRVDLDKRIEGYLGRLNEVQSLKALLHGTTHAVEGGRYSVQAIRQALEARFVGGVTAKLAADDRRHIVRLLRDEAFLDDVVREMAERRDGGMPGKTRNGDARFLSEALAESFEASRVALNARGANIGKLDGWAGPQRHAPKKLIKAGQEAWVRAAMGRLDLKRSFPEATPEEIPNILREVWTNIVTGRDRAETAAQRGDFTGPANLARSLERHRVLHFKDAESWLDYRREFGEGHIWDAFVMHQNHAARAGALMDVFGPNPEAMLRSIADSLESRVRSRADIPGQKRASLINDLKLEQGGLAAAFSVASGRSSTPVNYGRAAIYQAIRDAQSFGKLMGAVISSAGDLVTKAVALTHNGVPIGRAYADQILELLKGRGTGEARQIAFLAGEGYDGIIGHIASGYAEDALPGTFSRLVERGFRYSGLTWWTDANKAGMARMLSAQLGQNVALDHARLPDEVGRTLAAHAIGAPEWNAIRQAHFREVNGRTYVTPDRIRDLPDDAIAPLVEGKATPRKIAAARDALEIKVGAYFADEVGFGVLETDDAARSLLVGNTRPGDHRGEAWRLIAQFKGYPVAFAQRVLGREVNFAEGETAAQRLLNNSGSIAHVIAGTFVAGYASMTIKDYLAGYEARDPSKPKTILAALKQGGGLGIYGDFLFGEANRFGNGLLETIAGPGIGTGVSIINLALRARDGDTKAGEALNVALQNTPYVNLWYVKPVLDGLVLNSLRESLSPGFLARQERRRMEDFGQMRAREPEWFR